MVWHVSPSSAGPRHARETAHRPKDTVRRYIIHASSSTAILLDNEALKAFHNQRVEDHGHLSYDQSIWSPYQAIKSEHQVPTSGLSAFPDRKKTPMVASNQEIVLDDNNAASEITD